MVPDPTDLRDQIAERIFAALPREAQDAELARFYELLGDYPSRGGKMLRGRMLVLVAAAHGAGRGPGREAALQAAAALELFQNWVLVHDDIEDDSETRRGRPALHREVGLPVALNVGDALHVYMWDLLLRAPFPAGRRDPVLREFVSTIHRTAEGQHLDLSWVAQHRFDVDEAAYRRMVTLKTAYYTVVAPLRIGALCADVDPHPAFERLGTALGVAFQIRDDVLNLLPDEGGYGKEFAGDLFEGKRTLITARAFERATAAERAELERVLAAPREATSQQDVRTALDLFERVGAIDYAQQVAETLAADALAELRALVEALPEPGAATELTDILESLALRAG